MPYIKQEKRVRLGSMPVAFDVGELNYVISQAAHEYVLGKLQTHDLSYALLNETYGAMCAAAAEFYRTIVVPYEDRKRLQNGVVSVLETRGNEAKAASRIASEWKSRLGSDPSEPDPFEPV